MTLVYTWYRGGMAYLVSGIALVRRHTCIPAIATGVAAELGAQWEAVRSARPSTPGKSLPAPSLDVGCPLACLQRFCKPSRARVITGVSPISSFANRPKGRDPQIFRLSEDVALCRFRRFAQ